MATIKDVAKRAQVSLSTVSYALSGKRSISAEVRARVKQAMHDLNYQPSKAAQHLREGRSGVVGMVFPLPFPGLEWLGLDFVSAAAEVLQERYSLNLITAQLSETRLEQLLLNKAVDGLIVMEILRHDPRIERLKRSQLPFVMIGRTKQTEGLSFVDFDYEEAMLLSVKHLTELGHKHIAVLDFDDDKYRRGLGFVEYIRQGLLKAETSFDIRLKRLKTGPEIEESKQASATLLREIPALSAIIALNGASHMGALRALHDAGLRVPHDFSLISVSPGRSAEFMLPRLTAIDLPLAAIGARAASILLELMQGKSPAIQEVFPATLVLRESSAKMQKTKNP